MIEGPVEFVVIAFDGKQFRGEIIPAIEEVVEKGVVRIIDLVFIRKDENGAVSLIELADLYDPIGDEFDRLVDMVSGLIGEEDVQLFAPQLENNSIAAGVLFEHVWAAGLSAAVIRAIGRLVADEVIPREVVRDLIAAYGNPAAQ